MILNLYTVPVSSSDFDIFSRSNADHHLQIITALASKIGLVIYQLDPMPPEDLPSWLRRHQQAHNDVNGFLNVNGVDLSDVNFEDQKEMEAWTALHANEHFTWATTTGVF